MRAVIDSSRNRSLASWGNSGAEAHLVWAGPLGPESRLIELAGPDHIVGFAEEPMARLSPRSTALAGAIRAFNDWQPVTDAGTFYRAARARQPNVDHLMMGLALIARGDMSLPAGVQDTFAAVTSLAASQQLFEDEQDIDAYCPFDPQSPYCLARAMLSLDDEIFPPVAWQDDKIYSPTWPFESVSVSAVGFRNTTAGADVFPANGESIPALVSRTADGGYELVPSASDAFWSYDNYPYVDDYGQVHAIDSIVKYYVRLTLGPGGQVEMVVANTILETYPENPEIPDAYYPYDPAVIPQLASHGDLPAELLGDVPALTNRKLVMPLVILQSPDDSENGGYSYDVHTFGSTDGVTQRAGTNFTFASSGPATFVIDSEGRHAEIAFVNEDEPDIWRIRMYVTGPDGKNIVNGVLVPADAQEFTAQTLPGSYDSQIYGSECAGPYSDLETLPDEPGEYPGTCTPFIFTFNEDGSVVLDDYGYDPDPWSMWTLLEGSDAGRVLFHSTDDYGKPGYVYQRRGWELMHQADDTYWILENVNRDGDLDGGAPPIEFTPTRRLIRYELQ